MDPSFTTSMSPRERHIFQLVAELCQSDVQRLCGNNAFLDFVPTPPRVDVGEILEDMMMRDFQVQVPRDLGIAPPHEPVFFGTFSGGCSEDFFVNHVLLYVMRLIATSSLTSEDLASTITEKAQVLSERFEGEGDNVRGRMAGRLSEVTLQDIEQYRRRFLFLPFSNQENECLTRYRNNHVSFMCGSAIDGLLHTRAVPPKNFMQNSLEIFDLYSDFFILYALITWNAAVLYIRRRRCAQIFRAICSRPNIKKEVEKEVGSSVGNIPPFMALCRVIWMRTWTLLAVVVVAFWVLLDPLLGSFFATVCLQNLLWSPTDDAVECSFRCCGATPQDSATLTEAQACCKCCDDDKGCCAGGCRCGQEDDDKNDSDKSEFQLLLEKEDKPVRRKPARPEIYEGVHIQVV